MTDIIEKPSWGGVPLLTRTDRVEGGIGGAANSQAIALAARTSWLKAQVDSISDGREYTFYKTEDDPDGTISGLAGTSEGMLFRVAQGIGLDKSFIYYINNGEYAQPVADWLGAGAIESVIEIINILRSDVDARLSKTGVYSGTDIYPIVADETGKVLLGYDNYNDEIYGPGIIKRTDIDNFLSEKLSSEGLKKYEGDSLFPIVSDKENKVIFGYDSTKDEVFGSGVISNSVLRDEYSAGKYTGENIYPIVLDKNNNVIFGYDANQDSLIGLVSSQSQYKAYKDESLTFTPLAKDINQIIVYGQSLSVGVSGLPPISKKQPYSNVTFVGGIRGGRNNQQNFTDMKPLIEEDLNPGPGSTASTSGETICSGMANYASLVAYKENGVIPSEHVIFASSAGRGGMPISFLDERGTWYKEQLMQHIIAPKSFSTSRSIHAVMWLGGESNSDGRKEDGTKEEYLGGLKKLQSDIETDSQRETGQSTPVPFIVYQHSTNIRKNSNTALAFFDAITEKDSLFFFSTPTYMFPHADALHPNAVGYKWMGCYFGRAYKQLVHDKIRPRFIKPVSAIYSGNSITVAFNVPESPLVFDTSNLAPTKDVGFSIYSNGEKVNIKNIVVSDGNKVVITTDVNLLSAVQVKYAIDYLGDGLILQDGASGNLRDSTPDTVTIAGVERPLFYICPHFVMTAISGDI